MMMATESETLEFKANGGTGTGYLSRPISAGPHPGVIVIQEWWGLNANIKGIADRIAAEGYIALAPDLYHGQVGAEPDEAQKLMMAMSREQAMEDLNGAVAALDARGDVDSWKIGVSGFCMGGGLALALAMENPKIRVCAPFYGLPMGGIEGVKNIKGSVLGFYGAQDAHITPARVEELRSALKAAGIEHEIVIYPDADHAFFNNTSPAFHASSAADAWTHLMDFFNLCLRDDTA